MFAFRVVKYVKSNAIVFVRDGQTLGIGAGQMSRVDSTRIAASKAEHARLVVRGSVAASDAFFPFRDGIDALQKPAPGGDPARRQHARRRSDRRRRRTWHRDGVHRRAALPALTSAANDVK